MCILSELIWFLPLTLFWSSLIYSRAVKYEEQVLKERFGEGYIDYCYQVPRWWPSWDQLKGFFSPWEDAFLVEFGLFMLPVLFLVKELMDKPWRGM